MSSQQAKFIDVTRTFLPLDPKNFPVSMHGTKEEDYPEQRIPVMAYDGKNILPTAHGYTSYFGINRELDIDTLPSRCDSIFVVQNEYYRNVLVALTELGIFFKAANSSGAWTHATVMTAPLDDTVHYEWFTCVLVNDLYCYRQGQPAYQKVIGDLSAGVAVTSITPNFINMAGQVGIFAAGGRLGFWDSDGAIATSSLDDYTDFTPSILTLANIVTFSDVNGRIVTIRAHGAGYIIYCTKSIIFVRPNVEATFQWDPVVIFSNNGIIYPRQVALAHPDTLHFAYTSTGLYKIENGGPELIIPEVTDSLSKLQVPVYLKIMEGRYLCLEILDEDFINSLVTFAIGTIDEIAYIFPGAEQTLAEAVADELLVGTNMCLTLDRLNTTAFDGPADPGDKKAGTDYRTRWTAFLSQKGQWGPVDNWTNVPVATIDPNGVEANQCPVEGAGNLLSANNTTSVGKNVVPGQDMYIDSNWTMERFVAVQTAIWDLEEESISTFLNSVLARSKFVEKLSHSGTPYTGVPVTVDKQLIGDYARSYTKGYFGFSKCEFWLTRYCYEASKIYRIKRNQTLAEDMRGSSPIIGYASWYEINGYGGPTAAWGTFVLYPSEASVAEAQWPSGHTIAGIAPGFDDNFAQAASADGLVAYAVVSNALPTVGGPPYRIPIYAVFYEPDTDWQITTNITDGTAASNSTHFRQPVAGRYRKTEQMWANNWEEPYDVQPPIPDTGYCSKTGWNYTKDDDSVVTIAAAACDAASAYPPGGSIREAIARPAAEIGNDGSFCSIPFEPVTVPGTPPVELNWPTQTLTIPGGTFLMQDGSIAPVYPLIFGALVYDLHLKKWGKMNQTYRLLLDYSPVNNANSSNIAYADFGIIGGILAGSNKIKLFDSHPLESYITYGKVGFYRKGFTSPEEVRIQFAVPSTGFVRVDSSLNGDQVEASLSKAKEFTEARVVELTGAFPGRWQNITISGQFDIKYLEYRGFIQGKR